MTRAELCLLLNYIDARAESVWNTGPYASRRLDKKLEKLRDELHDLVTQTEQKSTTIKEH